MRSSLLHFALVVLAAAAAAPSATARAHAIVDEGIRKIENAEFRDAIQTFERAEAADDLTREDLIALYENRAVAWLAVGDEDAMEADVRRLASLDPDHVFGPAMRPEVRAAFVRVRGSTEGPPRVDVEASRDDDAVSLRATVTRDPTELVRDVRVFGRAAGGEWLSGSRTLVVPAPADVTVEHYAEAVGAGGAVLASAGSETSPLRAAGTTSGTSGGVGGGALVGGDGTGDDDDGGGGSLAIWVAAGIVAAGAIVGVVLLATSGGDSDVTQPSAPIVF